MAKRAPRTRAKRRSYHHGRLREALLETAEQMVDAAGPETVTVREAARRAGVSPGAPFRHFASRTALLTGVAERAMARFLAEVAAAEASVDRDDPAARLAALGRAYARWALRHPEQFRVISTRSLIDFDGSESLGRDNGEIFRRDVAEPASVERVDGRFAAPQRHDRIVEAYLVTLVVAAGFWVRNDVQIGSERRRNRLIQLYRVA